VKASFNSSEPRSDTMMRQLSSDTPDVSIELPPTRGPTPAGTPGGLTGDVVGALRSLGLVGVALRGHELNGWGGLVGIVLVVLAQENNFVVGSAGGVLWP
jgi:hypothetical protein